MSFQKKLIRNIKRKKSILILGIDPVYERIPIFAKRQDEMASIKHYFRKLIKLLHKDIVGVKLQSAFFEIFRSKGIRELYLLAGYAKSLGLITIFDGKRGDIDSTADAYAKAYLASKEFDAMTVNPYLGKDSIEPFTRYVHKFNKGIFILTRTTNPGSEDIQKKISGLKPIFLHAADMSKKLGINLIDNTSYSPVGLVAPSTFEESLKLIRKSYKECFILVPGIGAQKGSLDSIKHAINKDGFGALVTISRALSYVISTNSEAKWAEKTLETCRYYNKEIQRVLSK